MPQMRKLADAEVQKLQNKGKGTRKLTEEEYDRYLSDYNIGEYGEATLEPGENRLTVRNRFKAAARRRNLDLNFRRTSEDLLRFQIVEQSNNGDSALKRSRQPAAPPPPPEPVKRKGGRPKKSA